MIDRPWTAQEVADLFRVSRWTVGEWTRTGKLPRVPGIRPIRVPAKAIQDLLEGYDGVDVQRERKASTEAPPSRRRHGVQAHGQVPGAPVGGSGPVLGRVGPAAGDVVVSYVSRGSR